MDGGMAAGIDKLAGKPIVPKLAKKAQSLSPARAAKLAEKHANAPLAKITAESILDRYEQGELIREIAEKLNVSDVAVYRHLLTRAPEQWRDYQAARALKKLSDAEAKLESAADHLSLSRAREQVRSAQWELERLLSRLYGQKQEVTMTVNVGLADRLLQARSRVIEGVATHIPHSSIADNSRKTSKD